LYSPVSFTGFVSIIIDIFNPHPVVWSTRNLFFGNKLLPQTEAFASVREG
jgi:hypothetical protein